MGITETIGIIGLLLGIAVMIIGAYKGLGPIPLTLLATTVVILFNGLPFWDTLATIYATGFGNTMQSYFFIFVSSSIYAVAMGATGCTLSIGYKFIDWFGSKNALLISCLMVCVLTYGGVSLWVVVFAAAPIMFQLFKAADLPRHLTIGCLIFGCATITSTTLPGTPQLSNVIPTQYLGTTMTAAPIMSIIAAIMFVVINFSYLLWCAKKARVAGEHWSYPDNYDTSKVDASREELPSPVKAFIPIIVLLAIILGASFLKLPIASNSTLLASFAMTIGFVLCLLLNWKFKGNNTVKDMVTKGSVDAINAMIGLAAVIGFGSVVSSTEAFQDVVAWVLGINISVYWKAVIATAVIAGITGSASSGVRLCLSNMTEYFIASGCDLPILHRLIAIASGTIDSLPHASGLFLMLSYLGLNHKTGYKHVFFISVVTPTIVTIILTTVVTLLGL